MTIYGYDPARIVLLRTRTLDALDELRDIRPSDPAADPALRVVRLMRHNLEEAWLPLIEAIHTSTAMVAWRRAAGLVDDAVSRAISQLVGQLGGRSSWVTTAGLEHLTDDQLIDQFERTARRLLDALDGGGHGGDARRPPGSATTAQVQWAWFHRLAAEISHRDRHAPLIAELHRAHGIDGVERLLDVVQRGGELQRLGHLPSAITPIGAPFGAPVAHVVGNLLGTDDAALELAVDRVTRSPDLADLVISHPEHFAMTTIAALARELTLHVAGLGHWADRPRVIDHTERAERLLTITASAPAAALDLLGDNATLTALATSTRIDPAVTESVFASALGAGSGDPLAAFEVLAELVAISATSTLTAGAARGVAVASGSFLPALGVHLDRRLPVDVVVTDADGTPAVVRVGDYEDLARLLGQVMDDEPAQLALGLSVGAFRVDQRNAAVEAIIDRPGLSPADAAGQLTATLADVTRVVELLVAARAEQDRLHALRHGMARAQSVDMVSLLGSVVSWTVPPAVPLTRQVTTLTTRAVIDALGQTSPSTVPTTGIEAELAIQFTVAVVSVPTFDVALRPVFGLDRVPSRTWDEMSALLDDLTDEADPGERSQLLSRLERLVADDADLDTFLEAVRAASGESRQG